MGIQETLLDPVEIRNRFRPVRRISEKAESSDLERSHGLVQGLLEGSADGHGFSHGFHGGCEPILGPGEFLEGPARDFDHAVVDGRFKGSERLPGDVVGDFIQRVADSEFCRNLGNRKSRGLGGQGRASGHPGIHLDHHHLSGLRMDGKLDVGAPGFDADFPDDGHGRIPHVLVFTIGERLSRRHGDAVSRVNAHRIEVLDGADDHHVVFEIPHHLEFEFFPPDEGLFHDDFRDHAGIQAVLGQRLHLFPVVSDAAADAPEREAGPDDHGIADLFRRFFGLIKVSGNPAPRHAQPDTLHGVTEFLSVFRLEDHGKRSADHLHAESGQHTRFGCLDGRVQTCLASQGGQQRIGSFSLDDLGQELRSDRFDVGAMRRLRIGHDRGRVAVDKHHLVALFLEGLAGLGPRIVELAGLADHDGA